LRELRHGGSTRLTRRACDATNVIDVSESMLVLDRQPAGDAGEAH
jgi:hypothetical protein